jgi:hypothetical protein
MRSGRSVLPNAVNVTLADASLGEAEVVSGRRQQRGEDASYRLLQPTYSTSTHRTA